MLLAFHRFVLAWVALGFSHVVAAAAEPAIVAKARAFVGPESALNNVKSVRYTGTVVEVDRTDPTQQRRSAIEIIYQRPDQQRIAMTSDKVIEVTALDSYEGWQRVQDAADPAKWRQTLLGTDQIKRMRANTWENLSFFRGIERVGGRTEDQGHQTIDGVRCQKLAYIYGPNIIFYRFFDVATGRLVLTETESGGTIREQGEMVVSGIRFPRSITTASKDDKGAVVSVTLDFDTITVNEAFPAKQFAVPSLGTR